LLLTESYLENPEATVEAFASLDENAKAAMIQTALQHEGRFAGPISGQLTLPTLKAIAGFCARHGVAECRMEAMPRELLRAILQTLVERQTAGN
jgi:hypothetical protein